MTELPNYKGRNIYKIEVKGGRVRLNNSSYNPDGNTWSAPPGNNQIHHINIDEGSYWFEIFVGVYYGKANKIKLVNVNFFKNVQVEYYVEHISDN